MKILVIQKQQETIDGDTGTTFTKPAVGILFQDGCCWEVKPVVIGYDISRAIPGSRVPISQLPTITQEKLVVEDNLGNTFPFELSQYFVTDFTVEIYQQLMKYPGKLRVPETAVGAECVLEINPDWQEEVVFIPLESSEPPDEDTGVGKGKGKVK